MQRRTFGREFKLEAVNLVRDRGVTIAQAARGLDIHQNVLRKRVKDISADPKQAFPGHGQMKPEQAEIDRLRKEVAQLEAERDILKKAAALFAKKRREVRPHREAPLGLAGGMAMQSAGCVTLGLSRLAQPFAVKLNSGRCGPACGHPPELPRQRPDLWRPARLA
jgi:transposase